MKALLTSLITDLTYRKGLARKCIDKVKGFLISCYNWYKFRYPFGNRGVLIQKYNTLFLMESKCYS